MQKFKKLFLLFNLSLTLISLLLGFYFNLAKCFSSAGLLLTIAGILQLEITDFFKNLGEIYGNVEKYPYGPPSHITREIIDNPDTPVRTYLKNILFSERMTGVYFLIGGCLLQLVGTITS